MKAQIKILLLGCIFLYLLLGGGTVSAYYGSIEYSPINQLIRESDVVIIGTVTASSYDTAQTYSVWTVKVSEVLKDNLTEKSREIKLKTIYVFEKRPFSNFVSAVLANQEKHLLFLKAATIDGTILHELKISPSQAYSVSYGSKGVIFITPPPKWQSKSLETQYKIYNVNDYVNAVRDFCNVMSLEDKKEYKEGLLRLLEKGGKIYEESVIAELKNMGIKLEKTQDK